ncbi:condensation domain-containing protein [Nonomuraea endophytica]|uniref:condensation domain-containing protein n=1 Tax=Nonomuraea endophytica TaxID=714136 RepID=UPI0037C5E493
MPVEAALTFGQLFSWRDIERHPHDWIHEANLPAMWDLRGLTLDRVTAALRALVERHEALRTTYHVRDGVPYQRVHETVALPIELVERDGGDQQEAERTAAELIGRPFPMAGDLNWRGLLVSVKGEPKFLALSVSHLILDAWSVQHLRTQFRALIEDPGATAELGPVPRTLALSQRGQEWAARRTGAERHWRGVLEDGLMDELPTLPSRAYRNRLEATLHSRRIGGLAHAAAKRLGVTAPAVVMALVAAGVARQTGADRVTMSLMASNRFSAENQRAVGTLNQLVPVVLPVDQGATLAEHVRGLHWASTKAYRHGSYDIDRMSGVAAEYGRPEHGCWFNHLLRCWFNYLQIDDRIADPADDTPAELVWTPLAQQYGQPFRVRVQVQRGRTSLLMLADPDVVSADGMLDILRGVGHGVQLAATEPETGLKELWSGKELDPSLFPREADGPPR